MTSKLTAQASQTQVHARKLRGLLDEIKAIHRQLDDVIDRAKRTAGIDEITERILKMSNGFEKFAEVQPAMFEDVMDNELAKYDRFPAEIAELERKQSSILKNLEVCLKSLLRTQMLTSLIGNQQRILNVKEG